MNPSENELETDMKIHGRALAAAKLESGSRQFEKPQRVGNGMTE